MGKLIGIVVLEATANTAAHVIISLGLPLLILFYGFALAGAAIHDYVFLPLRERRERLQATIRKAKMQGEMGA